MQHPENSRSRRRRAARAVRENENAARLAREQAWRNTRRSILKAAPWALGGATATALGWLVLKQSESEPTDEEIILTEAKRLGIKESQEEKALWMSAYTESTPIDSTISRLELADQRLKDVRARMKASQNPYYTAASRGLMALIPDQLDLQYNLSGEASMGIVYELPIEGGFHRVFRVNPDFMVNGSTALSAADTLVHEERHLEQHEAVLADLQARYSGTEFYNRALAYFGDPETAYQNEFEAYAREAQSLIIEAGLVGHVYSPRIQQISGKEDRAVRFIQYGSDARSPQWQEYLRSIIPPPTIEQVP